MVQNRFVIYRPSKSFPSTYDLLRSPRAAKPILETFVVLLMSLHERGILFVPAFSIQVHPYGRLSRCFPLLKSFKLLAVDRRLFLQNAVCDPCFAEPEQSDRRARACST